jgi:ABC-type multidrug transport system ATPase subunit
MNAVMGPSGSGKTTFLNVLCGRIGGKAVITGMVREDSPGCCPGDDQGNRIRRSWMGHVEHVTRLETPIVWSQVCVNEEHMALSKLKNIIGFVPQDDIVHVDLTVR